jgi:hypothetical protein
MHINIQRQRRRLRVALRGGHREGGKVRPDFYGMLGSVIAEPAISAGEKARFWAELPARFKAVEAKFPGRLTRVERAKIEAAIATRIARPTREERSSDHRRFFEEVAARRATAKPKRSKGERIEA